MFWLTSNWSVSIAVAEKLVHLQHHEWLAAKPVPTRASIARGLAILDEPTPDTPEAGDELPPNYVSVRHSSEYREALAGRFEPTRPSRRAKRKLVQPSPA